MLQVVSAFAFSSDALLIAQVLGASKVPDYSVPAQMFGVINSVVAISLTPLWPAYGEALVRRDFNWIKRTLFVSIFITLIVSSFMSVLLVVLGPDLMQLWVGKTINAPSNLLIAIGIWKVVEAVGNSLAMFLNGASLLRIQLSSAFIFGFISVLAKYYLLQYTGIVGLPWGATLPYVLFSLLPLAYIVSRTIKSLNN